jgi:hypothetical protein
VPRRHLTVAVGESLKGHGGSLFLCDKTPGRGSSPFIRMSFDTPRAFRAQTRR